MNELLKNMDPQMVEMFKAFFAMMPQMFNGPTITLRVFRDEVLVHVKNNLSENYYNSMKISLNYLIEFFGVQKVLSSITVKELEEFVQWLRKKAPKGYRVYVRNLKAAFGRAVKWDYLRENPFRKIELPKKAKLLPAYISSNELRVISDEIQNPMVKHFVTIAFYTGMRLDEIINLTWKEIDLENKLITVGSESFTTKGKNQRIIPMYREVEEILKSKKKEVRSEKAGFVFCKKNGEKFTGDYFSRRFKKAAEKAGMDKGIHFHSLRHSFASMLVKQGVELYKIKKLLGHSSITVTEIYSHLNNDDLKDVFKNIE